jgi:hypothetical protein
MTVEHQHTSIAAPPSNFASRVVDKNMEAVVYIYQGKPLVIVHHQANTHSIHILFIPFSPPALGRSIRSIQYLDTQLFFNVFYQIFYPPI